MTLSLNKVVPISDFLLANQFTKKNYVTPASNAANFRYVKLKNS